MSKVNPFVLDYKIKIKSIKENAEYNSFYSHFCRKKKEETHHEFQEI